MRLPKRGCIIAALLLIAADSNAQVSQYTAPGGPGEALGGAKEQIERELEDARWRLGPIRLAPQFGIRQLSYQKDVFASGGDGGDSVDDVTASLAAGLTAYLPTGPDVFWTAEAIPEYVWWQDQQDRRQLVGRYGAGVFGFFNRLEVQARAGRIEQQDVASSEIPQPIISQRDQVSAALELRLTGKLGLYASGRWAEIRNNSDDVDDPRIAPFERLDRQERSVRAGLLFFPGPQTRIGLGVERFELDSAPGARDLSSTGTSPTLDVGLHGNRLAADVHLALRTLDPVEGSEFTPYDQLAGDFQVTLNPGWRFRFQVYGGRTPSLTVFDDYAFFEERFAGVSISTRAGRRLRLRVFAQQGENRYETLTASSVERTDDTRAVGAELGFQLGGSLGFQVRAQRSEIDSPLAGASRDVTSVSGGLTFSTSRLLWQ